MKTDFFPPLVGELKTRFPHPKAVAVDEASNVYTGSNGWNGGLEMFRPLRSQAFEPAWAADIGRVRGISRISGGRFWVSVKSATGGKIQQYGLDGTRRDSWAKSGTEIGNPVGLATDSQNCLYVTETRAWDGSSARASSRVRKYAADGRFLAAWGTNGSEDGQFNLPVGIAVGPDGLVYVADTYNSRVQTFLPTGEFARAWGVFGALPGEFNCPQGLVIGADGVVYVADTGNHRIQAFDPDGTIRLCWGEMGSGPGQLWLPCGIAVDEQGNVYVADTMNGRIQIFQINQQG